MEKIIEDARKMLGDWKGNSYAFGYDALDRVGDYAGQYGKKALLIAADLGESWAARTLKTVTDSLQARGVEFEVIQGARPNAPREDLYRLALHVARCRPTMIIAVGGGAPSMPPRPLMFWPPIPLRKPKQFCRFQNQWPAQSIPISASGMLPK